MNTSTPRTLDVTECHQLLAALLPNEASPYQFKINLRNYTLALLMLEAGLRVGEACRLLTTDLIFNFAPVRSLVVPAEIAKNKRERTVPISTRLNQALNEMHKRVWSQTAGPTKPWAFTDPGRTLPLTTRQVQRIIKQAGQHAIGRTITPHMLRHTFATRLMKKIDIRAVQYLLGHSSLQSTQIYTHPDSEEMRKAVDDCSSPPTNNL